MRGHYMSKNKLTQTIHHAIWVDTETDQYQITPSEVGHLLNHGWAAYSHYRKSLGWSPPEWLRFSHHETFWDWTEAHIKKRTKLYLFCHNTNFDLPILDTFRYLPEHKWVVKKAILEGPPTILELKKPDKTLTILDTLNWWRQSLKSIGKSIGLPKLEMPDKDAPQSAWDVYCKRDVEIIMYAVQRWCKFLIDFDLGGFANTLASQSMRTYRHRFMPAKILIDDNKYALACSRSTYRGGRTEAFFIGSSKERRHLVDVNSQYPYAMHDKFFPAILRYYARVTNPKDLQKMMKKYLICARCLIEIDQPAIAVKRNKKLIFPIGKFNAFITTPELEWVLKHGAIHKVYDMSMYNKVKLFTDFVDFFYANKVKYKTEGDPVLADMFKKLLLSIYGKFGQNGLVYEEIEDTTDYNPQSWKEIDADTGEVSDYRQVLGKIFKLSRQPESGISHPAICSFCTAYARMHLWRLIATAGRENVYYCDTDSLLVNDIGLERLKSFIDPTKLGMLEHEASYDLTKIHGAKDYIFGDKVRRKGVKGNAEKWDENVFYQDKWSGLAGMLRAGNLNNPTTEKVIKILKREYDKGQVLPSGRVVPFVLDESAIYPVKVGTR